MTASITVGSAIPRRGAVLPCRCSQVAPRVRTVDAVVVVRAACSGRIVALSLERSTHCVLPPGGSAHAAEEQTQPEHCHRADDGAEEEQHAGGSGHVVPENLERCRQLVCATHVGNNGGDANDYRSDQEDDSENHNHDELLTFTRNRYSQAAPIRSQAPPDAFLFSTLRAMRQPRVRIALLMTVTPHPSRRP
ncbi:hypothetical protein ACWIGX_31255 [Streptomyces nigrescens]